MCACAVTGGKILRERAVARALARLAREVSHPVAPGLLERPLTPVALGVATE